MFMFFIYSYGEKGAYIIYSAVYRLFDMEKTISKAFEPLKFTAFTAYVLLPYIAHLLIMQDLSCTASKAYEIMLESADTGRTIHEMSDGDNAEIEALMLKNSSLGFKERAKVRDSR
jgi:hypothetical protein